MRVLVTGGNGFIGRAVYRTLEQAGHEAIVFDRTGLVAQLVQAKAKSWFLGSVTDRSAVGEAIYHSDAVIHLAGILGTAETLANPRAAIETNLLGSLNVFEFAEAYQKPVVYLTLGNWFMNNPYSISKNSAERIALMFNKEFQTHFTVVRGYNVYGPGQKVGPVKKIIPTMITRALKGLPIHVYGDGSQIQDMIYIEDMATILTRALMIDHRQYAGVFEAGSGEPTTVLEIATRVIRACGQGEIEFLPMRPGETQGARILADPSTLVPLFPDVDWSFRSLESGLHATVEYYRSLMEHTEAVHV